jgi:hypothetical protein
MRVMVVLLASAANCVVIANDITIYSYILAIVVI